MNNIKSLISKILKEEFLKLKNESLDKKTINILSRLEKEDPNSKLPAKNKTINIKTGTPLARKIEQDVFDMIQQSYAKIGGNATIASVSDLNQYPFWAVADVDNDPEPDVVRMAKYTGSGLKGSAVATDGSIAAKEYLKTMLKQFYDQKGNWSEVSDAMAHLLINKLGIPTIKEKDKVKKMLPDKKITWHGEHPEGKFPGTYGWYTRDIGGEPHTKIIVGNI